MFYYAILSILAAGVLIAWIRIDEKAGRAHRMDNCIAHHIKVETCKELLNAEIPKR